MIAALLTIWAAILVAGDTPTGRLLRAVFVARPAAWCERVGRGHIALMLLLLLIGAVAIWVGGADAIRVAGMATPDFVVWATTFEVATYLDLAITVTLVASTLRLKTMWAGLYVRVSGVRRTARRRRRASRRPRLPANDDGDGRHPIAA